MDHDTCPDGALGVRRPRDQLFSIRFEPPCSFLSPGAVYLPLQLSEQRTDEWAALSPEAACALPAREDQSPQDDLGLVSLVALS